MNTRIYLARWSYYLVSILALLAPTISTAGSAQQFLALPDVRYVSEEPDAPGRSGSNYRASIDLLYALDVGQYRFFSEFVASTEKSRLARLHLGYETDTDTTFMLGRFQMADGYWNKTFHFRNYMQPSIQQPGIASYEAEGGALPSHFSGLKIKQQWQPGRDSMLQLEGGFGTGAKFTSRRLMAYDLLDPDGGRKPSTSLRLSYQPNAETDTEFGVFFVDNRIPMQDAPSTENDQRVVGGFGNTQFDALRLYGALYLVNNDLKSSTSSRKTDHFYSLWLQGDYRINANWTPYVRLEHSNADRSDPYIQLFPLFVRDRQLAGLRWDFLGNQAIKVEYANTAFQREDANQWAMQWSMMFP